MKGSAEFIDVEKGFSSVPNSRMKGSGIYALYDDYGLYYVGLSNRSLRSRIRRHTRDRHKNKWTRFSWYRIPRIDHVKDIESILLRIINPKGNRVKGKFRRRMCR